MNLWFVNHYADPPDGLSTRTFDLGRRMAAKGHRVTIFSSAFSHYHFRSTRDLPAAQLWRTEECDGVQFVWIRTWKYRNNDWRRVLNMASFAIVTVLAGSRRRPTPDVVSGVTVHPLAALAGLVLARLRGARFVIEVTDLWPQSLIDMGVMGHDALTARMMRRLERYLYRRAERLFMLWRYTEPYVASLGVNVDKIVWLPHGVEVERYSQGLRDSSTVEGEFRVLYLGAFVASMSLDIILDAASLLQKRGRGDITFALVGAGTNRDDIMAGAKARTLTNVTFPKAVPKSEVGSVMAAADAFIFGVRDIPLYKYGMSLNKLTDYLIGARPIVYFGRSTYDPVTEARAGFSVPPGDPAAVADAVERLADMPPEARQSMGERGRDWALEHHNIPKLAERFLKALEA